MTNDNYTKYSNNEIIIELSSIKSNQIPYRYTLM